MRRSWDNIRQTASIKGLSVVKCLLGGFSMQAARQFAAIRGEKTSERAPINSPEGTNQVPISSFENASSRLETINRDVAKTSSPALQAPACPDRGRPGPWRRTFFDTPPVAETGSGSETLHSKKSTLWFLAGKQFDKQESDGGMETNSSRTEHAN